MLVFEYSTVGNFAQNECSQFGINISGVGKSRNTYLDKLHRGWWRRCRRNKKNDISLTP